MIAADPPGTPYPSRAKRRAIVVAVSLTSLIQSLDTSISTVTLPQMQGSLSATQDEISWVMTTYLISTVVLTPLAGKLSLLFGRRRVLMTAVVGFMIAAVLAGQSTSLTQIVTFRLVQGMFAAMLMPIGHSLILDTHPPEEVAIAMGWRSTGIMFGMSVGPVIGSLVTDLFTWRWGFYINVPIGLAGLILAHAVIPEHDNPDRSPVSWVGFLTLAMALAGLQVVLSRGERMGWFDSDIIIVAVAASALGFYLFAVHTALSKRPFIDPLIYRDRTLMVGLLLVFVFVWMMFAVMVLLPAYLQTMRGYPITTAGEVMGVRAAATMTASLAAGWLLKYVGPRRMILFGAAQLAAGCWMMSNFTSDVPAWNIYAAGLVFGSGSGFAFIPLNVVSFTTLLPKLRPTSTSLFALMSQLGGGVGISVMVVTLVRSTQTNYQILVERVSVFNETLRHVPLPPSFSLDDVTGLARLADEVTRQAALIAYANSFWLLTVMTIAAMPLVYLMKRPPQKRTAVPAAAAAQQSAAD
jgi:DHA2 family multidrug resistance protein